MVLAVDVCVLAVDRRDGCC